MNTMEVFVSRYVIFHEKLFPFHNFNNPEVRTDPFEDSPIPILVPNVIPAPHTGIGDNENSEEPTPGDIRLETHTHNDKVISDTGEAETTIIHEPQDLAVRRSSRTHTPPSYLRDYHCNLIKKGESFLSKHSLDKVLNYENLSIPFKNFVLSVSAYSVPQHYHTAVQEKVWRDAMQKKIDAMHNNKTWSIVPLPKGKTPIGCRWIFTNKMNSDGTLARRKARLVAKGYTQKEGVDFLDTFSPVAKLVSVKFLLSLAASQGWFLSQLDISNAFLNGNLYEEVYMDLPMGYMKQEEHKDSNVKLVCRLHKSIYGLKQASRQWNLKFT